MWRGIWLHQHRSSRGFTLIEVLVVMGLLALLAAVTTIGIIRPQTQASLNGAVNVLVADLKSQQLKAMLGESGSGASAQPQGVFIDTAAHRYTVFKGAAYGAGDADNFVVTPGTGLTLATTFPSTQVVFLKGSGEVSGFAGGTNTITITNPADNTSKTITVNRYGAVVVN